MFKGLDSDAAYKLAKNLGVANKEVVDFVRTGKGGLKEYEAAMQSASNSTSKFQKGISALKNIGGTLLSTFTNMAVAMAASWAVGKVIEGIDNYIHRVEIAIEKGEEAREKLSSIYEEYDSASSVIEGSGERFSALREGVNAKTNENISLTNEEYSEYLSLCNQIADVYPQLVTSYDAQGNAILNLGTDAETATAQLDALLEKQQQVAYSDAKEEIGTALTGSMASIGEYKRQLKGLEEDIASTDEVINLSTKQNNILAQLKSLYDTQRLEFTDATQDVVMNTVMPHLVEYGIDFAGNRATQYDDNGNIIGYYEDLTGFPATQEEWDAIIDEIGKNLELEFPDVSNSSGFDKVQLLGEKSGIESQIQSEWDTIISDIQKFVKNEANYNALSTEMQELIQQSIANTDMSMFPELSEDEYAEYIENTYIRPISDLYNSKSTEAHIVKAKTALANLYNLGENVGTLNVNEYDEQLNAQLSALEEYWKTIKGEEEGEEFYKEFVLRLGFKVEDEDGNLVDANDTLIENIKEKAALKGEDVSDIDFESLTVEQLVAIEAKVTDSSYGDTILQAVEDETKKVQGSINSSETTFSSILSTEDVTKQVDDFQSAISSLDGALDTLRNGEDVDLTDLIQEFPELIGQTKNLEEALVSLKEKKLNAIISDIVAQAKDVGINGEEWTNVKNFIEGIINSSDMKDVNLNNVKKSFIQLAIDNFDLSTYGKVERQVLIDEINSWFDDIEAEANISITANIEDTNKVLSQISSAKSALLSQATGLSIDYEAFSSEELADYQSALEWVNGTLQLNTDKVKELTNAKVLEQIATNDAKKAQQQQEYKKNVADIEDLQDELRGLDKTSSDYTSTLSKIQSLQSDNSAIASQCQQIDLLNQSLMESIGIYQAWKEAQNAPESGDMFDDAQTAWEQIREVSDKDSENYGKVGNEKYQTAVDFLVPETVDHTDREAVSKYLDSVAKYLRFEDGNPVGLDLLNFMEDATEKGLMVLDEESGQYKIAGERTMEEFAEGLNLSLPFVQAIFGELEEYLPEGQEFVWSDSTRTINDLAVSAGEASNALSTLVGYKNIDIEIDVSDLETKEEKLSTLQGTIDQMNGILAVVNVDSTEAEQARTIIEYCVAQMQILNNPVVMRVDASSIQNESISNAITALQEFQQAQNTLDAKIQMGLDTTQAEQDVATALESVKNQPEAMLSVGINVDENTTAESIVNQLNLQTEDIYVKIGADIADADEAINDINNTDVDDKDFTVTAYDESTGTLNRIIKMLNSIRDKTITITTNQVTNGSQNSTTHENMSGNQVHSVNGTAHVNGTFNNSLSKLHSYGRACLNGNWGNRTSGTTLVGELGREIVVNPHTGRWYTVGDNGAEFVDIPQNAIVFNHIQTQELLENGYVSSRGKALANGTAMLDGQARAYTKGTTVSGGGIDVNIAKTLHDTSTDVSKAGSKVKKSAEETSSAFDKLNEKLDKLQDWIETKRNYKQSRIDMRLAESENEIGYQNKNKKVISAQKITSSLISVDEKAYKKYMQQAKSVAKQLGMSKELQEKARTGDINIEKLSEKEQQQVEQYQKWLDKAREVEAELEELKTTQKELAQQKLDNIINRYDGIISHIESRAEGLNNDIEMAELKGYSESGNYYASLKENSLFEQKKLQTQIKAMEDSLQADIDAGIIVAPSENSRGSEEWYEMVNQINEVKLALEESEIEVQEFNNQMRQIEWDRADQQQDAVTGITDEADFLLSLLNEEDEEKYDDKGNVTEYGKAAYGLQGLSYNVNMNQADTYAKRMEELKKDMELEPHNQGLIDEYERLEEAQRDCILAAEDNKQAMVDLVKEGIEKQLSALKDLIDEYMDAINTQKNLYDYQNNVKDQAEEVAKLQKRLAGYAGDDSEEGRLKRDQTEKELKEAQKKLEETQYDKFISDQQDLLDDLYDKYEETLNQRLDDIDVLIENVIKGINENSSEIKRTLEEQAKSVGVTLSDELSSIWNGGESASDTLAVYNEGFKNEMTATRNAIDGVKTAVEERQKIADENANAESEETKETYQVTPDVITSSNSNVEENNNQTSSNGLSFQKTVTSTNSLSNDITSKLLSALPSTESNVSASDSTEILKDKVSGIISKAETRSKTVSNDEKNKSDLWKYLVETYGIQPYTGITKKLADVLGVNVSDKLTKSDKNNVLKKLKELNGYASGTKSTDDEWAWINEQGRELVTLPNGSILMPFVKGSTVFNNDDTENILSLANDYDQIRELFGVANPDASYRQIMESAIPTSANVGSANIKNEITFVLPNVMTYEQFMYKFQHDPKAEKILQSMTIGAINGKSSLNKYNYIY